MIALVDFVLFQLAWFACVTQAAQHRPSLGVAAVGAFVLLQFFRSRRRTVDALLVALALVLGLAWDTTLLRTGTVRYASPGPFPGICPPWILALWALFAAILRGPLRWLQGRHWLAGLFGAIGGPASYLAAAHLGACTLPNEWPALTVLALGWAVFTPALVEAAHRMQTSFRPMGAQT